MGQSVFFTLFFTYFIWSFFGFSAGEAVYRKTPKTEVPHNIHKRFLFLLVAFVCVNCSSFTFNWRFVLLTDKRCKPLFCACHLWCISTVFTRGLWPTAGCFVSLLFTVCGPVAVVLSVARLVPHPYVDQLFPSSHTLTKRITMARWSNTLNVCVLENRFLGRLAAVKLLILPVNVQELPRILRHVTNWILNYNCNYFIYLIRSS